MSSSSVTPDPRAGEPSLLGKRIAPRPLFFPVAHGPHGALHWGRRPRPRRGICSKCGLTPHFVGSALGGLPQNASFAVPSARFKRALASVNR